MKFDEELALIAKRELALSIIRSSKNYFQCKDRYRQVKNINKKIGGKYGL